MFNCDTLWCYWGTKQKRDGRALNAVPTTRRMKGSVERSALATSSPELRKTVTLHVHFLSQVLFDFYFLSSWITFCWYRAEFGDANKDLFVNHGGMSKVLCGDWWHFLILNPDFHYTRRCPLCSILHIYTYVFFFFTIISFLAYVAVCFVFFCFGTN